MATTETRSELVDPNATPVYAHYRAGFLGWLTTTDHKQIAKMYAFTSFAFMVIGGIMALLIRSQLAWNVTDQPILGLGVSVPQETYNQFITLHGTIMVFLFVTPMLGALGNYIVPLQIGATDMAFPRVNALSYWMVPLGGIVLMLSYAVGGPTAAGWTGYSPLAGPKFSPGHGVDLWIGALAILGVGSTLGAINFIVTIFKMRAPGMTMLRLPVFCWTVLIQSILILFSFPVVTAGLLMLYIERNLGAVFFDPAKGGDVILYQHIFWYFGHPEVYILILPLMGAISEIIPVFSRKPLFGYKAFIFATLSIGALGTAVWAHHMFTTGGVQVRFFAATSFLISVPTGVKMFNWIATMYKGKVRLTSAMLFAIGFLSMFLIGGITGVFLASGSLDFALHDTYFVVGHFHYVLVSAALFAIFASFYFWFPKMTGRMLGERIGRWQAFLLFTGVNLTFFPQFWLGLQGMPRRIQVYTPNAGWELANQISTAGSYVIALSVALFFINVFASRKRGKIAGNNPWDAYALEWWTSSPPPYYNFDNLPPIRSERPVFDANHRDELAELSVHGH